MEVVVKIFRLLTRGERWQLSKVFLSSLLAGVISTVGVASVMPFMAVVGNPNIVTEKPWLAWVYRTFGFTSVNGFLFALGCVMVALITIDNAMRASNSWLVSRFIFTLNHDLSTRLLQEYLARPYSYFLNRNTADLGKNILSEVSSAVNGVVNPLIQAAAQTIIVACILGLLMSVNYAVAFGAAAILGGSYTLIYLGVRKGQARLGRSKISANTERYRFAQEALAGIKDVKVLGRENNFVRKFSAPSRTWASASANNAIVSQLPPRALELLTFGGIIVIVLYLLRTESTVGAVFSIVAMYAFAGYRLAPALQQIFFGLTSSRFNYPALDDLYTELVGAGQRKQVRVTELAPRSENPGESHHELVFAREIQLVDLSFSYPGAVRKALDGVSLNIPKNTTVGLVGKTGSGKTTLADLLLGLFQPTTGAILVDGEELTGPRMHAWRTKIGYVPQQIFLADDSVQNNIAFGLPEDAIDAEKVRRACSIAHLDELIEALPEGVHTFVGERGVRLSGGQRQRLGIARALYSDPEVLIMDEATSSLDSVTESAVMEALEELSGKKTIALIAHRMTTVELCDNIFMLSQGKLIAEGTYSELLRENPAFRRLSGQRSVG